MTLKYCCLHYNQHVIYQYNVPFAVIRLIETYRSAFNEKIII